METWSFGIDNDNLVNLVLKGEKCATTSLYEKEETLPKIGEESILIYDNEKKACITKTKEVIVTKFKNITEDLAKLEGEGDKSLEYYQRVHNDFFKKINPNFNDETKVVFEIFEVIEDLTKKRLEIAKKIVENNKDIFNEKEIHITEINAGFNNDLFNVNDKYVIKVCSNISKEEEFKVEKEFYIYNKDSKYIPKLYKYDDSKKIVPYVYEIIKKINGKSLYYYWYKMNELERENTIKEIVKIMKDIHKKTNDSYDWAQFIKEDIKANYEKTKNYFSKENQTIIENAITLYDKYLKDNIFALIHNDLHFDNIIKDNDKLYLIDFNDSKNAPIDYDFRIIYMCQETPWKWANIEMDPYQKKEDYINIFNYVKKYYHELNNIKYLEERMIIYRIHNDISLLTRFNNNELKENIINYSKKLIEV